MKKNWLYSKMMIGIAILYTLLVKFVDVGAIGPEGSKVGFQHLNQLFQNVIGRSDIMYQMTKYLGILPFVFVGYYAIIGLKQFLKKKSIKKVDKKILYLGGFYILVGITYLFFEVVVINYRPVLVDGLLEASYPSSHTMLALCICLSSLLIENQYIQKKAVPIVHYATIALMVFLVGGRLLSGVHWITDIIGGIIISLALVSIYKDAIQK